MSQVAQIEPEALTLANEAEALSQVLTALQASQITTPEQASELAELVREVKRELKQLEANCTETTRPTFERLEAMRDWFRPKRTALKDLERVGKLKLAEYAEFVRNAQTAAQTRAGAAFGRGDAQAGHAALAQIPETVEHQGISIGETLSFEVTDATQIPRDFLKPDDDKILEYVKATNGAALPGIRVIKVPRVAVRV